MAVSDYDPIIDAAAREWDVDPHWVRSIMAGESGGQRFKNGQPITSTKGAGGLMQIIPSTARGLGVEDVHDPVQAIWGGTKYLAQLRDQFGGNVPMATAAYNAGPARVSAYINNGTPLPNETKNYLREVSGHYQKFAGQKATAATPVATTTQQPAKAAESGDVSVDDFLKKHGAASDNASVDDFLKKHGADAKQPAEALEARAATISDNAASAPNGPAFTPNDESGAGRDEYGNPVRPLASANSAPPNPLAAIKAIPGAVEGWLNQPPDPGFIRSSALPLAYNPEAKTLGTGLQWDFHGPAQALAGMFEENSPAMVAQRGNITPDAALMLMRPGLRGANPLAGLAQTEARLNARIAGLFEGGPLISKAADVPPPLPPPSSVNPLSAPSERPLASSPYMPPEGGAAGSVGASAADGGGSFFRSAREIKGTHADMELADLMQTPQKGDTREHVRGVKPTKAEIEQLPATSREAKGLRQEFREGFNEKEKADNELYHRHFDDVAGTGEQVATLKDAREAGAERDLSAAFSSRTPVDPAPVVQTVQDILSDPRHGERDVVKKYITPYLEKMANEDGTPKTDPLSLYGIRENITDQLSKLGSQEFPGIGLVERQLIKIKDALDDTIEQGAPGFRQYRENYAAASRPIDAMGRLQEAKLTLTNGSDRTMTFGKFDTLMKNLWLERHNDNPLAKAKAIDQDTWDHLLKIHKSLARSASDQELAKTRGSDSTQLFMELGRKGLLGALHAGAAAISPGLANLAVNPLVHQFEHGRAVKKAGQHLNPDLSKYPDRGP